MKTKRIFLLLFATLFLHAITNAQGLSSGYLPFDACSLKPDDPNAEVRYAKMHIYAQIVTHEAFAQAAPQDNTETFEAVFNKNSFEMVIQNSASVERKTWFLGNWLGY